MSKKLICPRCGCGKVATRGNLAQCRECGHEAEVEWFNPALCEGLYKLWLVWLMGADWVARNAAGLGSGGADE